jgi:hypothetical protein
MRPTSLGHLSRLVVGLASQAVNGNPGIFELSHQETFPWQQIANVIVEVSTIQKRKSIDQQALRTP